MNNDLQYFESHYEQILQEFAHFLSFRSVSSDNRYLTDCINCAHFLTGKLQNIFTTELWEYPGHPPVIYAYHRHIDPSKPTLLIYNHYDVQPADLSDGWLGDPFIMRKCGNKIFARGASDNKGQCFYALQALQYYYQSRQCFPVNILWIIEGEEEHGSPALQTFIHEKESAFHADHCLILDGGFPSAQFPCINIGARGLVTMKVTLKEGDQDMHSGIFGGKAYNVNRALAQLLSSLYHSDHSIAVENFYQDVTLPEEGSAIPIQILEGQNVHHANFSPVLYAPATNSEEAVRLYPTLDINGMSGGYTGPGFKTVIPHQATAYLSCRLVPYQRPKKVAEQIIQHLKNRVPSSLEFSYEIFEGSPGWRQPKDLPIISILNDVYSSIYHRPCFTTYMEATIPIAPLLEKASGAKPVIGGVSYYSDAIHAAEENFSKDQLRNGFLSICQLLDKLGKHSETCFTS
ncbi:Succinyl-diaminopimelate desuccinylase [Chlamydia avium]|uniref:Beta-Ala-His dipeptidase n=1 Tax=Chlamydia avium 10DC88 TaxID=1229831 RepID=W8K0K6_9CHLA|nr:M20/M25/M40 family metallo-hydrolase [Chlamydia avium]AHK63417.1 Beta-Ala-His dipeptidase [Chlamydia avium 10DC88]VVT43015.1 Succinyl-diaminopimelate desuccinylase [Chlamydia avium]